MLAKGTVLVALVALVAAVGVGCGQRMTLVELNFGPVHHRVSVNDNQARVIRALAADEPKSSVADRCAYWKKAASPDIWAIALDAKDADVVANVVGRVEYRWCKEKERQEELVKRRSLEAAEGESGVE